MDILQKNFNSFLQSAVDAGRKRDENETSSLYAQLMKLLVYRSDGYQILYRRGHTVTKYLSDEEAHAAISSKLFQKPYHVNNSLYEGQLDKA